MSTLIQALARLSPQARLQLVKQLRADKSGASPSDPSPTDAGLRRRNEAEPRASIWQEQMWYLEQLQPGTPTYNVPFRFDFDGPLDQRALERALSAIERRHDALRTTIQLREGRLVQIVAAAREVELELVDLGWEPDPAKAAEAAAQAFATIPAGLLAGPAYRVQLLRLSEERHVLLWIASHSIADGWSIGVLARELTEHYRAYARNVRPEVEELPLQFADYAAWQHEVLSGPRLDELLEYWRKQLEAAPVPGFPTDFRRPALQSHRGNTLHFAVPRDVSDRLIQLGRQRGATPFMTLLAAYQTLIAARSGQHDCLVASPVTGRGARVLDRLIGSFVNVLVVRTNLEEVQTFPELLGRVREATLSAFAHQDLPFGKLVQELAPPRDPSRSPFCQALFLYGSTPLAESHVALAPDLQMRMDGISTSSVKFDFDLAMDERPDGFHGRFDYCVELFTPETAAAICADYVALLSRIAASPDQPMARLLPRSSAVPPPTPPLDEPAVPTLTPARSTTATEVLVAEAWSHALGVEPVRRTDDFFALGGHSVLAARLVGELRERFRVELTLPLFLENTTVAELSAIIDRLSAGPAPASADALRLLERVEQMSDAEVTELLATTSPAPVRATRLRDALASAWCRTLSVELARDQDDFFGLGGHSVLAAQLVAELRGRLGVEFTLADFLCDTTFAGVLSRLRQCEEAALGAPAGPSTPPNAARIP